MVVVLLGLLTYFVYLVFQPFLTPLTWAVVLVVFFRRLHEAIQRRIPSPNLAALASTLTLTLLFIVPMFLVFSLVANQTIAVTQRLVEEWRHGLGWRSLFAWVERLPLQYLPIEIRLQDLRDFAAQNIRQWGLSIAERGGTVAQNVLGVTVDLLVTLLASFYLFRDGAALMRLVRAVVPARPRLPRALARHHRERPLRQRAEQLRGGRRAGRAGRRWPSGSSASPRRSCGASS